MEWRRKFGNDTFNEFSDVLSRITFGDRPKEDPARFPENRGSLKLDATVADQNIAYPNDLGLLNKACEKMERIIDGLFEKVKDRVAVKPRTYRQVARKKYLAESKKRQVNKKTLRSAIRYQLNCLDRNIKSINHLLELAGEDAISYSSRRDFWIIQTLNGQQRKMYDGRTHICPDRIVSISQPYFRPIVRGKNGKKVEFGTKIGLAQIDGFVKAETLSWNAYNESADLIPHAESYRELKGHYPELIQVDKIYGTNKNRKWCAERGIRMTVVSKGKKVEQTAYEKRKSRTEFNERNHIEAKFGQAKQGYGLNNIKAKLSNTSHAWIGSIFFITNLLKFAVLNNFHF